MPLNPCCIFCQIIRGESPAEVLFKDDLVTAFMDIRPVTPGHLLVVPNYHTPDLAGLPEEYASHILVIAGRFSAAIKQSELGCDAVNLFLADGEAAGQTVFHTHMHVLPRFLGDGFGIRLHNVGARISSESIADQAAVIRSALEKIHDG